MTLIDFTLSNARRFYSSMGNPTGVKGLTTARFTQKVKTMSPLTLSLPRVTLIDFTLSNARGFNSSMGNPTGVKGLRKCEIKSFIIRLTPWAGKMNQIPRCDWLPGPARCSYTARSGFLAWSRKIKDRCRVNRRCNRIEIDAVRNETAFV